MKVKKRFIVLKNPRLRKIRTELRNLLKQAFIERYLGYFEQMGTIRNDLSLNYEEKKRKCTEIEWESEKLRHAYLHSITGCRVCGKSDVNLMYNPVLNTWFCERCYNFNQKCQDGLLPLGIYYP